MMTLRVVQINLKHSKCATDNLRVLLAEEDLDIGLIQEPWVANSDVKGFSGSGYNTIYARGNGRPRSCIIAKKSIDIFLFTQLSSEDLTVARVELPQKRSFIIASSYMAHGKTAPPAEVRDLMATLGASDDLILGCDANARHSIWGSREINDRGEEILDFINNNKLCICNSGDTPTFIFPSSENYNGWEEVLDITLISERSKVSVDSWRVSNKRSFSDHNWILFNIGLQHSKRIMNYRNPRRTDWSRYNGILGRKLRNVPSVEDSVDGLEKLEGKFSEIVRGAFEVSCPITRAKKSYPPWWSTELSELRRDTRRAFNASYESKSWQPYREKLKLYKRAIVIAKRNSWRSFCESIDNTKDSARLSKVLAKGQSNPAYIRRKDNSWSESSAESLDILLETHFPGCKDVDEESGRESRTPSEIGSDIISQERISWAMDSFSPYKSPGPDGILPRMLQSARVHVIPWLYRIFSLCLSLDHVPVNWRKVRVVFIPKTGRRSHENAKDFRPISLSSFQLKTLERLIDAHIRQRLEGTSRLSGGQHAYLKGRSTETALHEVVGVVERSLEFKQYTLGAFLDIEGAFNNVTTSAIQRALTNLDVEEYIGNWLVNMLSSRIVTANLGNSIIAKQVERGTPQGGVISPLLWLIVVNEILLELDRNGIKAVAYADDVVILVSGLFPDVISNIMSNALRLLSNWATACGLEVNPGKTELVLFTTKTKVPSFRLPRLGNREIPLSDSAKYLGVILHSKLSWKLNTQHRVRRATVAYYTCRRMFGAKWGLSPRIVNWMYKAIVRPILTYGSLVWWTATERGSIVDQLYRVQRSACIGMTGALRTSPSEALNAIMHLVPIDLHIRAISACSAVRLNAINCWRSRTYGHAGILDMLPTTLDRTLDYVTPYIDFGKPFKVRIPSRREWGRGTVVDGFDVKIYTDGSRTDDGVGAGVFCEDLGIENSHRLPNDCSILQAEVFAVLAACRELQGRNSRGNIGIFIDSQATLLSLDSCKTTSVLVGQCKNELSRLSRLSNITLVWIPAHRDHYGNERADELARMGSTLNISNAETVGIPLGFIKSSILRLFLRKADDRWRNLASCRVARQIWPSFDEGRTGQLLSNGRRDVSRLLAVITGHWALGRHASRLGLPFNGHCHSCGDREKEETIFHFLCECPALAVWRRTFLGDHVLSNLGELSRSTPRDLLGYLKATGWI